MFLFSFHTHQQEIDIRDAKLAISLHDTRVIGMDPRVKLTDVCEQLNSIALPAIPQSIRHRLCKLSRVRERTYTYVPGSEAYPEVIDAIVASPYILLFIGYDCMTA